MTCAVCRDVDVPAGDLICEGCEKAVTDLQDLFSRAGASDEDREAWLAERRTGITATEVSKLAQSPGYESELRKIKAGIETFSGNKYTEWGRLREPVIAEHAKGYGLEEERRVFHAVEDSRFLASLDLVGSDFDGRVIIGEIKTSKHDLDPAHEYFWTTTYYDQMQWQLFVSGAEECTFFWEQHDDSWPDPTPYPVRAARPFGRDEERIGELRAIALRFLDGEREEAGLTDWQAEYLEARAARDAADSRMKKAQEELAAMFPDGGSVENGLGKVTVSFPRPRKQFDSTAFKSAHPELHKEFQKEVPAGGLRVTVTPVKESSDE